MIPADLASQWRQTFGTEPPCARPEFLQGNLAYHYQAQEHGGLSPKTIKQLEALALGQPPKTKPKLTLRPGTKLIRLWQGQPHEVTVQEGSTFRYKDQTFPSLSAIANRITGTKWNGKAFFKLTTK